MPQITLPTGITEKMATLIDNIFPSKNVLNFISGNIIISISNYLPQFIVLDSLLETSIDEDSSQLFYRSFKNFNERSVSVRGKLYKEMVKAKNNQVKKRKHEICKTYRIKIVELLKVSRKCHYQKYFKINKKSSRAIWQGIHDIVYSKRSKKNNTPSSLLIDGRTHKNPTDMQETLTIFLRLLGKSFKATSLLPESTTLII